MGVNSKHCGNVIVNMSYEIWKPIPGFEDRYEISNFGRVKSLPKYTYSRGYPQLRKEKILKPRKDGGGYLCVVLSDGNGIIKEFKVHKLVGMVFVSNDLMLPLINHKDENRQNNKADNLEWCNNAYNVKYSAKPLTEEHKQKLRKPRRKKTEAEKQIRRDWNNKHKELFRNAGLKGAEMRWKCERQSRETV